MCHIGRVRATPIRHDSILLIGLFAFIEINSHRLVWRYEASRKLLATLNISASSCSLSFKAHFVSLYVLEKLKVFLNNNSNEPIKTIILPVADHLGLSCLFAPGTDKSLKPHLFALLFCLWNCRRQYTDSRGRVADLAKERRRMSRVLC